MVTATLGASCRDTLWRIAAGGGYIAGRRALVQRVCDYTYNACGPQLNLSDAGEPLSSHAACDRTGLQAVPPYGARERLMEAGTSGAAAVLACLRECVCEHAAGIRGRAVLR